MNEFSKKVEKGDGVVEPSDITPESINGQPFSEVGDWDSETARQLAGADFNRRHEREVDKLGKEVITEKGIDTSAMGKGKKEALIRQLGDELFHKMAREEQAREQTVVDDKIQKGREAQEKNNKRQEAEAKKPMNRVLNVLKGMFTGRER